MAVSKEKIAKELVTESAPLSQQHEDASLSPWDSGDTAFSTPNPSSQDLPVISDSRGISQVLPEAIQEDLQHPIFISSAGTPTLDLETVAPPIQVQQQVDVITYEQDSEQQESEVEVEVRSDLGEQIPDEEVAVGAMEVTVWSTEDQEAALVETEEMINQSSTSINQDLSSNEEDDDKETDLGGATRKKGGRVGSKRASSSSQKHALVSADSENNEEPSSADQGTSEAEEWYTPLSQLPTEEGSSPGGAQEARGRARNEPNGDNSPEDVDVVGHSEECLPATARKAQQKQGGTSASEDDGRSSQDGTSSDEQGQRKKASLSVVKKTVSKPGKTHRSAGKVKRARETGKTVGSSRPVGRAEGSHTAIGRLEGSHAPMGRPKESHTPVEGSCTAVGGAEGSRTAVGRAEGSRTPVGRAEGFCPPAAAKHSRIQTETNKKTHAIPVQRAHVASKGRATGQGSVVRPGGMQDGTSTGTPALQHEKGKTSPVPASEKLPKKVVIIPRKYDITLETFSRQDVDPVRTRRSRKKAVIIPRENDTALETFSHNEVHPLPIQASVISEDSYQSSRELFSSNDDGLTPRDPLPTGSIDNFLQMSDEAVSDMEVLLESPTDSQEHSPTEIPPTSTGVASAPPTAETMTSAPPTSVTSTPDVTPVIPTSAAVTEATPISVLAPPTITTGALSSPVVPTIPPAPLTDYSRPSDPRLRKKAKLSALPTASMSLTTPAPLTSSATPTTAPPTSSPASILTAPPPSSAIPTTLTSLAIPSSPLTSPTTSTPSTSSATPTTPAPSTCLTTPTAPAPSPNLETSVPSTSLATPVTPTLTRLATPTTPTLTSLAMPTSSAVPISLASPTRLVAPSTGDVSVRLPDWNTVSGPARSLSPVMFTPTPQTTVPPFMTNPTHFRGLARSAAWVQAKAKATSKHRESRKGEKIQVQGSLTSQGGTQVDGEGESESHDSAKDRGLHVGERSGGTREDIVDPGVAYGNVEDTGVAHGSVVDPGAAQGSVVDPGVAHGNTGDPGATLAEGGELEDVVRSDHEKAAQPMEAHRVIDGSSNQQEDIHEEGSESNLEAVTPGSSREVRTGSRNTDLETVMSESSHEVGTRSRSTNLEAQNSHELEARMEVPVSTEESGILDSRGSSQASGSFPGIPSVSEESADIQTKTPSMVEPPRTPETLETVYIARPGADGEMRVEMTTKKSARRKKRVPSKAPTEGSDQVIAVSLSQSDTVPRPPSRGRGRPKGSKNQKPDSRLGPERAVEAGSTPAPGEIGVELAGHRKKGDSTKRRKKRESAAERPRQASESEEVARGQMEREALQEETLRRLKQALLERTQGQGERVPVERGEVAEEPLGKGKSLDTLRKLLAGARDEPEGGAGRRGKGERTKRARTEKALEKASVEGSSERVREEGGAGEGRVERGTRGGEMVSEMVARRPGDEVTPDEERGGLKGSMEEDGWLEGDAGRVKRMTEDAGVEMETEQEAVRQEEAMDTVRQEAMETVRPEKAMESAGPSGEASREDLRQQERVRESQEALERPVEPCREDQRPNERAQEDEVRSPERAKDTVEPGKEGLKPSEGVREGRVAPRGAKSTVEPGEEDLHPHESVREGRRAPERASDSRIDSQEADSREPAEMDVEPGGEDKGGSEEDKGGSEESQDPAAVRDSGGPGGQTEVAVGPGGEDQGESEQSQEAASRGPARGEDQGGSEEETHSEETLIVDVEGSQSPSWGRVAAVSSPPPGISGVEEQEEQQQPGPLPSPSPLASPPAVLSELPPGPPSLSLPSSEPPPPPPAKEHSTPPPSAIQDGGHPPCLAPPAHQSPPPPLPPSSVAGPTLERPQPLPPLDRSPSSPPPSSHSPPPSSHSPPVPKAQRIGTRSKKSKSTNPTPKSRPLKSPSKTLPTRSTLSVPTTSLSPTKVPEKSQKTVHFDLPRTSTAPLATNEAMPTLLAAADNCSEATPTSPEAKATPTSQPEDFTPYSTLAVPEATLVPLEAQTTPTSLTSQAVVGESETTPTAVTSENRTIPTAAIAATESETTPTSTVDASLFPSVADWLVTAIKNRVEGHSLQGFPVTGEFVARVIQEAAAKALGVTPSQLEALPHHNQTSETSTAPISEKAVELAQAGLPVSVGEHGSNESPRETNQPQGEAPQDEVRPLEGEQGHLQATEEAADVVPLVPSPGASKSPLTFPEGPPSTPSSPAAKKPPTAPEPSTVRPFSEAKEPSSIKVSTTTTTTTTTATLAKAMEPSTAKTSVKSPVRARKRSSRSEPSTEEPPTRKRSSISTQQPARNIPSIHEPSSEEPPDAAKKHPSIAQSSMSKPRHRSKKSRLSTSKPHLTSFKPHEETNKPTSSVGTPATLSSHTEQPQPSKLPTALPSSKLPPALPSSELPVSKPLPATKGLPSMEPLAAVSKVPHLPEKSQTSKAGLSTIKPTREAENASVATPPEIKALTTAVPQEPRKAASSDEPRTAVPEDSLREDHPFSPSLLCEEELSQQDEDLTPPLEGDTPPPLRKPALKKGIVPETQPDDDLTPLLDGTLDHSVRKSPPSEILSSPPSKRSRTPSLSPQKPKKALKLRKRKLAAKDSTGEITMGTPHYSLDPFQPGTRQRELELDSQYEELAPVAKKGKLEPVEKLASILAPVLDPVLEHDESESDQVPEDMEPASSLDSAPDSALEFEEPLQVGLDSKMEELDWEPRPVEVEVTLPLSSQESTSSHLLALSPNKLAPAPLRPFCIPIPKLGAPEPPPSSASTSSHTPPPPSAPTPEKRSSSHTSPPPSAPTPVKHSSSHAPPSPSALTAAKHFSSHASPPPSAPTPVKRSSSHAPPPPSTPTPVKRSSSHAPPPLSAPTARKRWHKIPLHIRSVVHAHYCCSAVRRWQVARPTPLNHVWAMENYRTTS